IICRRRAEIFLFGGEHFELRRLALLVQLPTDLHIFEIGDEEAAFRKVLPLDDFAVFEVFRVKRRGGAVPLEARYEVARAFESECHGYFSSAVGVSPLGYGRSSCVVVTGTHEILRQSVL